MSAEIMIACENLTKRFGHFTAVDRVSVAVGKPPALHSSTAGRDDAEIPRQQPRRCRTGLTAAAVFPTVPKARKA
jgi:hypothetical protein